MTNQRMRRRISRLTLIALVLAGFASAHTQPKSGDWKVVTGFGQFIITVSAGGSSVTKIAYTFASWKCGPSTVSGGITHTSTWSITNNQFTINTDLTPDPLVTNLMTINGTFSPAGDQVSGTWSANMYGTICSGSWGPVGPVVFVDQESGIPERFSLGQNYPNPLNPSTTIRYELPTTSHVNLTVYDILGRQVSVLVNESREAGVHEAKFDGSNLASGVYYYRLIAGDFVSTKTLLIQK